MQIKIISIPIGGGEVLLEDLNVYSNASDPFYPVRRE
jgi:hypothetical protein